MVRTASLAPQLLRELLEYNPESGGLLWLERSPRHFVGTGRTAEHKANNWNARWAGKPALTSLNNCGYRRGPIFGIYVQAHRAIWALTTGEWPDGQIDHINGDRSDNRWRNLRIVGHVGNGRNAKKKANNTTGHTGVYWWGERQKWIAQIHVEGRKINLGHYADLDDAIAARRKAEIEHGFSETHGRRE